MRYDGDYTEAGADFYEHRDERNREHLIRYHQQALTRLGVHLIAGTRADPSPPAPPPGRLPYPHTSKAGNKQTAIPPPDLTRQLP